MTDNTHTNEATQTAEDALGKLLSSAGPRLQPNPDQSERVKANVQAEWQRVVQKRSTLNKSWLLGSMAAAVATVFLTASLWEKIIITTPPDAIASIQVLKGTVYQLQNQTPVMLRDTDVIEVGTLLKIGDDSGLAMELRDGQSVRFKENTEVTLVAHNRLSINQGSVYVDSNASDPNIFVAVDTPFGLAKDIGTQFMVTVFPDAVQVAVREGQVELSRDTRIHSATLGEQIQLDQQGALDRQAIDVHGDQWNWLSDLAPVYETNGRTLSEFLTWICRENGWTLVYTSREIELGAQTEELQGTSTQDMSPDQALEAVFTSTTTTKKYHVGDGVLTVGAEQ